MKILFIGDPHIKTDNGEEVDLLIKEIQRVSSVEKNEKKYDYIIVGGDVMHYHERLFTLALNKALHFIDILRKIAPTYILVGNHDAINNSIFLTEQHWMNALKSWDNVVIVDNVMTISDTVGLCPYVPPKRLIEAFSTKMTKEEWMKMKVWFVHQEINGCRMGAILSENSDEWLEEYPILISGHIHDHQQPQENVYYPGTPLQHSFGDSDVRVLTKIEIENDVNITYLPIDVPVKKILKTVLSSIDKVVNVIRKERESNRHISFKIKIEATTSEFSAFKQTKMYRELLDEDVKIQLCAMNKREDKRGDNENIEKNDDNNQKEENDESNDLNDSKGETKNFKEMLEEMVKGDEKIVRDLYDEIVLEKMILEL
jgi:UDP-2,3-diacylglucosamine pyrophosphatase LpxH